MVEQVLDLAAVAAAAVGVLAIAGVHQQQHGALQLLRPVPPLLVAEAHACLINPPCLSLQHKLVGVTGAFTDTGGTLSSCRLGTCSWTCHVFAS